MPNDATMHMAQLLLIKKWQMSLYACMLFLGVI